jgi:hypothetical protein
MKEGKGMAAKKWRRQMKARKNKGIFVVQCQREHFFLCYSHDSKANFLTLFLQNFKKNSFISITI